MRLRIIVILLIILGSQRISAQLDLEHWFPPYFRMMPYTITETYLYISTDKTDEFPVKIYTGGELIAEVVVSKSNPVEFKVPQSSVIEAAAVRRTMKPNNMGLHLTGAQSFYASLRIAGCYNGCRSEIFASKGKSGLGNDYFLVMDQIILYGYQPAGMSYQASFMATQDNTHIKVSNYDKRLRFADGDESDELNITLNKDESYILLVLKKENPEPPNILDDNDPNPIGARVTSDKPIIVNNGNFYGQDLGETSEGDAYLDQAMPTDKIGKEYFIVNGMTKVETLMDKAIIVATQDNTKIYLNNEPSPYKTLNKGEFAIGPYSGGSKFLSGNQPSFTNDDKKIIPTKGLYIKATQPIYLYQLIGGYDYMMRGPDVDQTVRTGAMLFSYPLDKDYFPKPQQNLSNTISIPNIANIGAISTTPKLSIKTETDANIYLNGSLLSNPSPMQGKSGWGYYTIFPESQNVEIISDKALNVDAVGGFKYSGYGSSYTGFSNDPYILVNGNCIQEGVYLSLSNTDFLSFQWQKDGVDIPDATHFTYQPLSQGNYQCVVTYLGFSYTTPSVMVNDCPYTVFDVDLGSNCQEFQFTPSFEAQNEVFSSLEIITQPLNGNAEIQGGTISVVANAHFEGEDRMIIRMKATSGYTEVQKIKYTILPSPIADVATSLNPISVIENVPYFDLSTAILNENGEIYNFYPTFDDAKNKTNEILNVINYQPTNTAVFVRVTNNFGCWVIKEIEFIIPTPEVESVTLSNAFTPNGDGINDTWDYSLLKDYSNLSLLIFNGFGQKVYQHAGTEFSWNGKDFSNAKLPSAAYWVVISYSATGQTKTQYQWVLLKNR